MLIPCVSFAFPVFQVLNIFYKQLQQYFFNWQQSLWNMKENIKYKLYHISYDQQTKHLRKYIFSKNQKSNMKQILKTIYSFSFFYFSF